jgi:hypothetical protein
MSMHRVIRWSAPLAVMGLIGTAPAAFAQSQQLFEWSGRVDREVQIVMRGNSVRTNLMSQTETRQSRSRVMSSLPRQDGQVAVRLISGRGNVQVVQQPSRQNGYSTVIRVTDPSGGAANYRLAAYWQGYANGDVYRDRRGNDRADRDDDRGHGNMNGNRGNNGVRNHGVGNGRGRGNAKHQDRDRDYDNGRNGNGRNGNGRNGNGGYDNGGTYGTSEALRWSGNVDGELELRIQNGRVNYQTISGANPTSIRANVGNSSGTRSASSLVVVQNQGRGTVRIVQQPAQWNGYTTIVRIRDPQGGYGYYDFSLLWQ